MGSGIDRREFLRRSAAAGMAVAAAPAWADAAPRVRRYVTLGKTGLRVSDIGCGTSSLAGDDRAVRRALDRGVTYFDTADSYEDGRSEATLGRALAGRRQDVVLISKCQMPPEMRRDEMMASLEGSLRRLRTDHLDVHFNHAVNDVARLANPEWHAFTARAKEQGKIRFVGMSGHAGRLVECVDYATEHELVDVFLAAFNFGQDPRFYDRILERFDLVALQPKLPEALRKAKAKGIGVVTMKTLRGAKHQDLSSFQGDGATFAQAAFRWVLSHDAVDSLVVTMETPEQVDEYLGASGWTRSAAADGAVLARYEAREGARQCRYGCDDCVASCPAGVAIPEVLRTRMYAEDYGRPELARREYRALEVDATACASCSGEPCATACPHGLPVSELTKRTARILG
ncbi:MAG TPA: aldo/keto reductase [Myxococcota bacterium]|nr:aldo/keto reductase [Myxococcota bacterium]